MRKFVFNKLVRDKIPTLMAAQGEVAELRTLGEREYRAELISKLGEEVTELTTSADIGLDEVVDLLEVIRSIASSAGLTEEHIKAAENSKKGNVWFIRQKTICRYR